MLWTAILIGLAGSLHCAGMCSPLVMAVTSLKVPFMWNRLLYNLGRILTYGLLGVIVTLFGAVVGFGKFQHLLTILLGAVLVALGIAGAGYIRIPYLSQFLQRVTARLKTVFSRQLQTRSAGSMLFLGGINGLLPCGLTYLALANCLSMPEPYLGFVFMVAFGAGTLPVMLGLTSVAQLFVTRLNLRLHRFVSIAMILIGALLIFRAGYEHGHEHVRESGMGLEVICR